MRIAVIGTGYVGLVQAVGLSALGFRVSGLDIDREKIALLEKGRSPIYEPGLTAILKRNLKLKRLTFTTDAYRAIKDADIIFMAVGTPSKNNGSVDLRYVKQAGRSIGQALAKTKRLPAQAGKYRLIANKSTVPIGTGDIVAKIVKRYYQGPFDVVSNPEFLREGQAVHDFFNPDRIVIGGGSPAARRLMKLVYRKLKTPILFTDVKTAELIKYASNSFLATSISFINSLAWLAEKVGADIQAVSQGMKLDKRIGRRAFLTAGPSFGGSCFPKDVAGLLSIASSNRVDLPILRATAEINERQKNFIVEKVIKALKKVKGKTIAVWGVTFKAGTDDVRESPAIAIIKKLLHRGAKIKAYDPVAERSAAKLLPQVVFNDSADQAVANADLLLIMTEWPEFKNLNMDKIRRLLKSPLVVDGRNLFQPAKMRKLGITYYGVGRWPIR